MHYQKISSNFTKPVYIHNHTVAVLLFLAGVGILPGVGGCRTWPAFDRRWVDVSILLGTRVIMKFLLHTLINIIMHIHVSLGLYASQSIFFLLHIICLLYIVAI